MRLTKEYCESVARSCSDTKEFWYRHRSVAQKALREGWYEEYTWLPRFRVPRNHWSEEACLEEAKKYGTKTEFLKGSPNAYYTACRKGWLKAYTFLERKRRPRK